MMNEGTSRALRAERWAAPEPARVPSGDRPAFARDEGRHDCGIIVLMYLPIFQLVDSVQ
jgi:hypothetical protein